MASSGQKRRWLRRSLGGGLLATAALAILAAPAFAGTLTNVNWTVSNSQTGKTAVTYAFSFKTATTGIVKTVTMAVPAGTAGTPVVGSVYGLGAGTVALAANTLTYTVTTPVSVAANIPIYVSVTGMTNSSTAGSRTSLAATNTSVPAVIDSGTSQSIMFGSSSTTAQVSVGRTLTFTNDTPSFTMSLDPTGLSTNQTQPVVLTVQTNASGGYSLAASDTGLSMTGPAFTIPGVTAGPGTGVASFPSSGFGVSAVLSGGGPGGANFLTTTGPTGATADTLTLTNQVNVDYTMPAGTYNDTITYVVTPTY